MSDQEQKKQETAKDAQKDNKSVDTKTSQAPQTARGDVKVNNASRATAKGDNGRGKKPFSKSRGGHGQRPAKSEDDGPAMVEQVISINRITKVTKGGKKLSFSALVVVGDTKGNVGYSLSKAREVALAIRKAMAAAKKTMVPIPMKGSTIPHEIIGQCGGSRVLLKPAAEGTGVIASGPVRAICDGAGIHNILTKCHRSNNPINVIKATMNGLSRLKTNK